MLRINRLLKCLQGNEALDYILQTARQDKYTTIYFESCLKNFLDASF